MRAFAIALLTIAVVGTLVAVTGAQMSGEQAAKRALVPAISALTDAGRIMAVHRTEMSAQAEADTSGRLAIPTYPLAVTITAAEVQALPPEELEQRVLERSADLVYREGASAFRQKTESGGTIGTSPSGGLVSTTLNQLTSSAHSRYFIALIAMLVFSLLIGGLLLIGGEPHHGLILIGIGVVLAGLLFFLGTTVLIVLLDATRSGTESSVTQLMLTIDREAVAGGRRNGMVALILGFTLIIFGVFSGVVAARPRTDAYA